MRLRKLIKAALSGGAARHRAGPSDGVLAFGGRADFLDRGRPAELARGASGIRPIGAEVEGEEEALRAAAAGFAIYKSRGYHLRACGAGPGAEGVGRGADRASGDIAAENAAAYAAASVDVLVTSAPYRAPPLDFTTRMRFRRTAGSPPPCPSTSPAPHRRAVSRAYKKASTSASGADERA
ncbi:MAG: hypothetical protein JZD41_03010 [Thermoproteus sp.]|nr:hypothetical protein [Thermoproteus sp.]